MKHKSQSVLCFSCANIFPDEKKNEIICPVCGYIIERGKYCSIIEYSSNAITYGYLYREEYQSQMQPGESIKQYSIEPSEIINFIATVVLSGIIGNASYDLIKLAIKKIKRKYNKTNNQDLANFIAKNEEIHLLIKCLKDYYNGLDNVDIKVRELIEEEIRVKASVRLTPEGLWKKPKKVRIQKLIEIHRKVETEEMSPWKLKNLSSSDFDNLWSFIDKARKTKAKQKSISKTASKKSSPKSSKRK